MHGGLGPPPITLTSLAPVMRYCNVINYSSKNRQGFNSLFSPPICHHQLLMVILENLEWLLLLLFLLFRGPPPFPDLITKQILNETSRHFASSVYSPTQKKEKKEHNEVWEENARRPTDQ